MRNPFLCSIIGLMMLSACASQTKTAPATSLTPEMQRDADLEKRWATTWVSTKEGSLEEIFTDLQTKVGGNMVVLWNAIEYSGVKRDQMITQKMTSLPAKTALDSVLMIVNQNPEMSNHLVYRIHRGVLYLAPIREFSRGIVPGWICERNYNMNALFLAKKTQLDWAGNVNFSSLALKNFALARGLAERLDEKGELEHLEDRLAVLHQKADELNGLVCQVGKKHGIDFPNAGQGEERFLPVCVWGPEEKPEFFDRQKTMEDLIQRLKETIGRKEEWDENLSVMSWYDYNTLTVKTSQENHAAIQKLLDEMLAHEIKNQQDMLEHAYVMHYLDRSWKTLQKTHDLNAALKDAKQAIELSPDHPTAKAMVGALEKLKAKKEASGEAPQKMQDLFKGE